MDQKIIKIISGIIAGFVVVLIVIFLLAKCTNHSYTYEKLENKMMKVAKDFYKDNEKELPSQDGDTKTYTLKKMISDGKIEELTELFDKEDIKCDGNITITNNNGYYLYTPYLNCGKEYETKYLKDVIIEKSEKDPGFGLYEVKGQYIMKGEVKDNYLSLDNEMYRIIRVNEDGTIRVLKVDGIRQKPWDNRYNDDARSNTGINEYTYNGINSRVKEAIDEYYNQTLEDSKKAYIVTQSLCTGKRTSDDITKDGSTECSQKLENQQIGMLATYEYLQATLDENCLKVTDRTCKNYNWIANLQTAFWTITANSDNTKQAFMVYQTVSSTTCSNKLGINPVFNLDSKLTYTTGTGTENDPYIVMYDED